MAIAVPGSLLGTDPQGGEENLLLEHLRRQGDLRAGLFAVQIHLSDLKSSNRKPHFIRVARRAFEPLEHSYDATLFRLSNQDLVLSCRDVPVDEVDQVMVKVRSLFSEDPLAGCEEGSLEDHFSTWYDLAQEEDFANFKEAIADIAAKAEALRKEQERAEKAADNNRGMTGEPLTPKNLAAINQELLATRLSDLIRQQPAMRILPPNQGEILFREYFVSMADLQGRVAQNVNLFSSTWLFHYLTETVDKRMLVIIGRRDFSKARDSVSINLNIATVLSQEFNHFHKTVADHATKVVIEIQLTDIFADLGLFHFARESLQARGYRVLIDGITPLTLQFFDPSLLKADYVKIAWGPEFAGEAGGDRADEMRDLVNRIGRDRMVLGRVDSEIAVRWGLGLGIQRFQGYYVDTLVERMVAKGILAGGG
ncbi:MAG: hypothetical protein H7841_03810 [Magnetospirillum sp. WYHS-4]